MITRRQGIIVVKPLKTIHFGTYRGPKTGPLFGSRGALLGPLWSPPGVLWGLSGAPPEGPSGASLGASLLLFWGFPGDRQGRGVSGKASRYEKRYVFGASCAEPSAARLRAADESMILLMREMPSTGSTDANYLQSAGLPSICFTRSFV